MSDSTSKRPGTESFDREIDVRAIVQIGIWLAVVTIVSYFIAWLYYRGLASHERRVLDAKPSPIAEANVSRTPPGPGLLARPTDLLKKYRAIEHERLESWGWVDKSKGIAHVPIEHALDVAAQSGLPSFAPPESAAP
jgi:hypothetical protein